MKKKLLAVITAACALVMAFALVGCGSSSSSKELRFVTGGESGTYYAYGTVLAQYATNNGGIQVNALSSDGSKANIQSLQSSEAEIGFCQADVASYAYNGTKTFSDDGAYTDFSVVAALYPEQVQIVTVDSSIKSVSDLKGKTVSIGAANSGVYFNAMDILEAYGLSESDITPVYQSFADSADSLQNGKIDAAFITAGAPTTAVTNLATSKSVNLVSLDASHIAKLQSTCPFYTTSTIKAGTYTGQTEDCTTVATAALIVANDSVDEDTIYNLTKSLFDGAQSNASAHAKYAELNLTDATSYSAVAYHAGAAKYFAEQGITVATK